MKYKRASTHTINRAISMLVVWAFLFNTIPIYAVQESDSSNLAPRLYTSQPDYNAVRYGAAVVSISHKVKNALVEIRMDRLIKERGQEWLDELIRSAGNGPIIIPIPDYLRDSGDFAHVGLGRRYGKPVIYVDSAIYNDPDDLAVIKKHEIDGEIKGWEEVRNLLGKTFAEMREWIIVNVNTKNSEPALEGTKYYRKTSLEIGDAIHEGSYPVDALYKKHGKKIDLSLEVLKDTLMMYDGADIKNEDIFTTPENRKDLVIAAGITSKKVIEQSEQIATYMREDNGYELSAILLDYLTNASREDLIQFLRLCDDEAIKQPLHSVESRYPILRAAALLEKKEQDKLVAILKQNPDDRKIVVVDSILWMLNPGEIPSNWVDQHAPEIKGRTLYENASEVFNPAGGLGRVMQFHGLAMHRILKAQSNANVDFIMTEPMYDYGKDREGRYVKVDYAKLLGVEPSQIKEVDRFDVIACRQYVEAIVFEVVNKYGIKQNLFVGRRKTDAHGNYFTQGLYQYRHPGEPNLVTLEEFSAFISAATTEFSKRKEQAKYERDTKNWKAPIIHNNDGQLAMGTFIMKRYYGDTILKDAIGAFTSHTFGNRCTFVGEGVLDVLGISYEDRKYATHRGSGYNLLSDQTSLGARTSDWYGGVADEHVDRITEFGYDNWGEWKNLQMVAVTNGDMREITAHFFRDMMQGIMKKEGIAVGGIDLDHPTPELVLKTKTIAKNRFGLNPNQPVLSYSGRCVREKAGRLRALTDNNIRALVEMGVQVVIGANCSSDPGIVDSYLRLVEQLKSDKSNDPQRYPGSFTFLKNIDIEVQRQILAASDAQVQDSDPHTEAAGYSEANIAACGGIEIAPPWKEGILQKQGVKLDLNTLGKGNTVTPDIDLTEKELMGIRDGDPELNGRVEQAYLEAYKKTFKMGKDHKESLEKLSHYQATSVRLSRILTAFITASEYLRQFNAAVIKKEGSKDKTADKGSIYNCIVNMVKFGISKDKPVSVSSFAKMRGFSETTVRTELNNAFALGLIKSNNDDNSKLYFLSEVISRAPPSSLKTFLDSLKDIPELDRYDIINTMPLNDVVRVKGQVEDVLAGLDPNSALAQVDESIKAEVMRDVWGYLDLLSIGDTEANFNEDKFHEIRYNPQRISRMPHGLEILRAFTAILKFRAGGKDRVTLIPSSKVGLVSIRCYKYESYKSGGNFIGEGTVDVRGNFENSKLLDLMDVAFAASHIRSGVSIQEMDSYESKLVKFIKQKCKELTGEDVAEDKVLSYIKSLPRIKPINVDDIESYNRLTARQLELSA